MAAGTFTPLVPASEVEAVVMNVTVRPDRGRLAHRAPSDVTLPTASNLHFVAGQTVPNLVIVAVGVDGKFKINNTGGNPAAGSVQIIADIVGYYT